MKKRIAIILIILCAAYTVFATTFSFTMDTSTPQGSDDPAEADDRMREIKSAIQERENVNHYWPLTGSEVSDADTGEHRFIDFQGPNTAPALIAENKGRLFTKDVNSVAELIWMNENEEQFQISSKGQTVASNTFLTSVDAAGTGSVDLIKADANDDVVLSDGAELATSAAPTTDQAIANKKYHDDNISVLQVVNIQDGEVSTTTTTIPLDNTIPQITEGGEFMTLAITPTDANNQLKIEIVVNGSISTGATPIAALFQDSTADALASAWSNNGGSGDLTQISFTHFMTAGTTSETTFRVRAGMSTGGTFTFNGRSGSRFFGGTMASSITITEIN